MEICFWVKEEHLMYNRYIIFSLRGLMKKKLGKDEKLGSVF